MRKEEEFLRVLIDPLFRLHPAHSSNDVFRDDDHHAPASDVHTVICDVEGSACSKCEMQAEAVRVNFFWVY